MHAQLIRTVFISIILCGLASTKILFDRRPDFRPELPHDVEPVFAAYASPTLKQLSMGFDNADAGLLWIHLLQKVSPQPVQAGHVSWEFLQTDTITTLDPNFESAYHFGSMVLSVMRHDKQGTQRLLQKWADHRPTFWFAHYLLAFHLYSELNDYQHAAKHMLRAASLPGAPPHLASLGIRLLSETGALEHSLQTAVQLFQLESDNVERNVRLKRRIRSLNFALQREQWNRALKEFRESKRRPPDEREWARLVPWNPRVVSSDLTDEVAELLGERFSFRYNSGTNQIESIKPIEALGIDRNGIFRPGST